MNYKSLLFDDTHVVQQEQKPAEKVEKGNQPIQFDGNFGLERRLGKNGEKQQYGLTILFEEDGKSNEIKYELSVSYLGLSDEHTFLYQIDRTSPVYINEIIPDLLADKLAYEAGKIFYPLVVETRKDGKFLSVKNSEAIRKRWIKAKAGIEDYFEGVYAAKYIRLMDERLADDHFIQICFRDDWFIQTYFQSIYKNYLKDLSVEGNLLFPNLEPVALGYKTTETVSPRTNHFGSIMLQHEGYLEQDETQQATGGYQAKYILSPASKAVQIIIAEWWIKEISMKKVTLKLFTMDKLDHEKLPTNISASSIEGLVFLDGNKTNKSNKGFWSKWF
ncbi:hypothetical protein [Pedobacter sp. AJM]|uniref:hypothetical protein n=1 Tax=Pedobacter sp. AJM TaxID=2003629 RepID=UPI000B4AA2B4|nr:hypothetical protein [Pedobacter sp. AJM]OWK69738.1 hypothetical protein CBW18_15455 [Pedobacter sp. AJM]